MLAIMNSLNAHNFPKFKPILMIIVSKFMVHRALSDKTNLLLELLFPLSKTKQGETQINYCLVSNETATKLSFHNCC